MRALDYATQVSELEKIARLAPRRAVERSLPPLREADRRAKCLVCGASPARCCASCGGVSYCGVEHQRRDARWHDVVCDALRDIAEDERSDDDREDLVADLLAHLAGRNHATLTGWDDLLGAATPLRRRRLSDLATRPLTLAHALQALEVRATVVHVMAASQRELEVPIEIWATAGELDLTLVGPELPDAPRARVRTRRTLYSRALWAELGRPDLVIGYDCGLMMYPTWKSTILELRGSGVPFVITSYRDWEAAAEARLLSAVRAQCLLPPAQNRWASLAGKRSSTIANDLSYDNAFVSAWR